MKTKPTQIASRLLNETGIQADFILGRSEFPLDAPRKRKLSISCNVKEESVISAPDVKSIYEVLLGYEKEGLGGKILKSFGLSEGKSDLKEWEKLVETIHTVKEKVKIGIVGKYFQTGQFVLSDSYISVIEAIKHAAWSLGKKPEIVWLSSEKYEESPEAIKEIGDFDGIIVPGGFGSRGTEGKIKVVEFCRKNKIPYFGLCFGMQLAVIEFARHVCGLEDAHSTEIKPKCKDPIIDVMFDQKRLLEKKSYGGTMRLGSYSCKLQKGTRAFGAYGEKENITERHRHRYEFNNKYRDALAAKGIIFSGTNTKRDLVEIIEIKDHPFFMGVQFHPELKSRPLKPHPLFKEFIKSCIKQ